MNLIRALTQSRCYPHSVGQIRLIETHISWVLLTGEFVYKIKKPLDLGFLDFTTLERRRFFCDEELRLNRRLAAEYYLEVVTITGTENEPTIGGSGQVIEYALKMKQFPPGQLLRDVYTNRSPDRDELTLLARQLAEFHQSIAGQPAPQDFGSATTTLARAEENFAAPLQAVADDRTKDVLHDLARWTQDCGEKLAPNIERRLQEGFVRECHGDLHLGNIYLAAENLIIFDCIEFAPDLRWIDVINDLAFLTMDLRHADHTTGAFDILNRYLHVTGDYEGLQLWPFYEAYRAMVRAKIAALRAGQTTAEQSADALREMAEYIALADTLRQPQLPRLVITHGFSGSGKSTVCQDFAPEFRAIWLRSDVERKRLHGLSAQQRSHSGLDAGIYQRGASEATYGALRDIARVLLRSGFRVVVDATFLQRWQRQMFSSLAAEVGVPWSILHCHAPQAILKQWLHERSQLGTDPSEADDAVLASQLAHHDPLDADEKDHVISIDTSRVWSTAELVAAVSG